jgi:hypothetical protein
MAVELQIRASILSLMAARLAERSARATCIAPMTGFYLDHLEPDANGATWDTDAATALLHLPVEVFVVSRAELLASIGKVPAGAVTSKGRPSVVLRAATSNGDLSIGFDRVDLGPGGDALGPAGPTLEDALKAAAGAPTKVPTSQLLKALKMPLDSPSVVTVADGLVAARFGNLATPAVPVTHDFGWGLSLDPDAIGGLMRARVPTTFGDGSRVSTTTTWRPGPTPTTVPRLDAEVEAVFDVPDPFSARLDAHLHCQLTLRTVDPALLIDVAWELDVHAGLLTPALQAVVDAVADKIVDPSTFGGEKTGNSSFRITVPLPAIAVAGERWRYDQLLAGPGGMVIGGGAFAPTGFPDRPLTMTAKRFNAEMVRVLYCSKNEETVPLVPKAHLFSTIASVRYDDSGTLCNVEMLPDKPELREHLTMPKPLPLTSPGGGRRPGEGWILVAFSVEAAAAIDFPIQVIVMTTRGVRAFDLGTPTHVTIDADGLVVGGEMLFIDDCNKLPPNFGDMTPEEYDRWTGVIWYTYWGLVPGKDYDPENPPIIPDTLAEIPADWSLVETAPEVIDLTAGAAVEVTVPEGFAGAEVETGTTVVDLSGMTTASTGTELTTTGTELTTTGTEATTAVDTAVVATDVAVDEEG